MNMGGFADRSAKFFGEAGPRMSEALGRLNTGGRFLGESGARRLSNAGARAQRAGGMMRRHPYRTLGAGAVGYGMYRGLPGGGSRRASGSSGIGPRSTGGYA